MTGDVRELVLHPDPRLLQECAEIRTFDLGVQQLADDMLATMYANNGIGLAAPQIGEMVRLIVLDCGETRDGSDALILVNPEIISASGTITSTEGCLSFPGALIEVKRSASVIVRGEDATGKATRITATALWSICVQHEIDHLYGVTFLGRHMAQNA